ncbi:hypothetical protein RHMOL_Rhmol11G0175600 [Rhododendron molle]|uniref:Uncharacterized protein n=1 Tax=Rhododendron molle TaxID=49168 RepID=A0ACC0LUD6_RHOML|nr:hypothetical protein RHMOL_Rhmol11G0175600 [Rhododendron molle]
MMMKVSAMVVAVMDGGNSAMVVTAMDGDEGRRGEGGVHRGEQARRRRSEPAVVNNRQGRDVTATGGGWRWQRHM